MNFCELLGNYCNHFRKIILPIFNVFCNNCNHHTCMNSQQTSILSKWLPAIHICNFFTFQLFHSSRTSLLYSYKLLNSLALKSPQNMYCSSDIKENTRKKILFFISEKQWDKMNTNPSTWLISKRNIINWHVCAK